MNHFWRRNKGLRRKLVLEQSLKLNYKQKLKKKKDRELKKNRNTFKYSFRNNWKHGFNSSLKNKRDRFNKNNKDNFKSRNICNFLSSREWSRNIKDNCSYKSISVSKKCFRKSRKRAVGRGGKKKTRTGP